MRQFHRLVMLVLVVAALAALLVTPVFAADPTILQPEPTAQPVVITSSTGSGMQFSGAEMLDYSAIKIEVQIPGDIYVGCSRYSSTDTLACMQRFCSGQSAGEAVLENGVYRCVNHFTPQSAPKRN